MMDRRGDTAKLQRKKKKEEEENIKGYRRNG